jgi:hypothetical protein
VWRWKGEFKPKFVLRPPGGFNFAPLEDTPASEDYWEDC